MSLTSFLIGKDGSQAEPYWYKAERESLRSVVTIVFWNQLKERYLVPAEKRLGPDATAAEKRIGRSMGFDAAIDYALTDE